MAAAPSEAIPAEASGGGFVHRRKKIHRPDCAHHRLDEKKPIVADGDESESKRYEMDFHLRHSQHVFTIFQENCLRHPDRLALQWVDETGAWTHRWTYAEFNERIANVAEFLVDKGLQAGDRVLLVYPPTDLEIYCAIWACWGLDIIPVPVGPPEPNNLASDNAQKLRPSKKTVKHAAS